MSTKTITATGNLTAAPELRHGDDGTPYAYLTIAVNDAARTDEGDWHDLPPVFYTVAVRGRLAENSADSITKGDAVTFTGKYRLRAWIDNDGQIRIDHVIKDADVSISLDRATAAITRNPKTT